MEQIKQIPNDVHAEEYLLGTIMVDNRNISTVLEMLTPEAFYSEVNRIIFEAIVELTNKQTGIDLMTVSAQIKKKGKMNDVGGLSHLMKLTNSVGSTANIVAYCAVIKEKYLLRQLVDLGQNLYSNGLKTGCEVNDLISIAEKGLTQITTKVLLSKFKSSKEMFKEILDRNDEILKLKAENRIIGLPTGLKKIDYRTSGWQNGNLIILAARPGMGKTSLALTFVSAPAIKMGVPTAFFSLEMPNIELYARLVSQHTGVDLRQIMYSGMQPYELQQVLQNSESFCDAPIYFDDQPAMTLFEVQTKARKLKREKGIGLLVIDYLQLIRNEVKGSNREGEISSISRGLKALAKELDIPIIALAQLSRASEKRGAGARPMLSDLRESGSIEQDADIVLFINRPEYYGIAELEDGHSSLGIAELIFAKGRNIGMGETEVGFTGSTTKFFDLEENKPAPF